MKPSKDLALLIMSKMKKGKGDDRTTDMAKELLGLIKEGDAKALGLALKNFMTACQDCKDE